MKFIHQDGSSTILDIYVQPGSKNSQICGTHGDRLKLKVASPPVDGKANEAVIAFFADFFHIAKRDIEIVSGDKSRLKRIKIQQKINLELIFQIFQ